MGKYGSVKTHNLLYFMQCELKLSQKKNSNTYVFGNGGSNISFKKHGISIAASNSSISLSTKIKLSAALYLTQFPINILNLVVIKTTDLFLRKALMKTFHTKFQENCVRRLIFSIPLFR